MQQMERLDESDEDEAATVHATLSIFEASQSVDILVVPATTRDLTDSQSVAILVVSATTRPLTLQTLSLPTTLTAMRFKGDSRGKTPGCV